MGKILFLLFFFDFVMVSNAQTFLRKGYSSYGDVLYNWDGQNMRKGSGSYGDIFYTTD